MKICVKCHERFTGEEISEWKAEHEAFSERPLVCPDCWDNLQKMDLEDQFSELMNMKEAAG